MYVRKVARFTNTQRPQINLQSKSSIFKYNSRLQETGLKI